MDLPELVNRLEELGLSRLDIGAGGVAYDRMCVAKLEDAEEWEVCYFDGSRGKQMNTQKIFKDEATACWYLYGELASTQASRRIVKAKPGASSNGLDG
jgi:hypothetical protein